MATTEWLPFNPGSTVRFLPPVGSKTLEEPPTFREHYVSVLRERYEALCDPAHLSPCCEMTIRLWNEKLAPNLPVPPPAALHVLGGFR